MKKALVLFLGLAFCISAGCSKSSGNSGKDAILELTKISNNAAAKIKDAKNEKEAVQIVNEYAEKAQVFADRLKELDKANPKWADKDPSVKEAATNLGTAIKAYIEASLPVLMNYAESKEISAAGEKLQKAIGDFLK